MRRRLRRWRLVIWFSSFLSLFWLSGCGSVSEVVAPDAGALMPPAMATMCATQPVPTATSAHSFASIPTTVPGMLLSPSLTLTPPPSPSPEPVVPSGRLLTKSYERPQVTMDIALNVRDRRLDVTQVVLTTNTTGETWREVVFAVMPAHKNGVVRLKQVEVMAPVVSTGRRRIVVGVFEDMMLHVPLPRPVRSDESVMITLVYQIRIPSVSTETWLPEGNLGAGAQILQMGDWHPVLAPYQEGEGWRTWRYHPVGDPVIYPVADYDIQILTDPEVVVAAPGEGEQVGGLHHYQLRAARSFAFLASLDYQVMVSEVHGIPLRAYYLPGHGVAAEAALRTAAEAISLYVELFGPYPTSGLVIAQNAYWGSMEYSGLVTISGYAFQTYQATPKSQLVSLTAHEVAHQWWYGAVGNDQVYEPWLDEAFAKYSELLYYERYAPELVRWWWDTHVYRFEPEGPLDRTIYDFPTTPVYFNQLYGQAARFMDDLRQLLGDEAFFAFVKAYRAAGEGRLVGSDLFFETLAAVTDQDLNPLLERYFTRVAGD